MIKLNTNKIVSTINKNAELIGLAAGFANFGLGEVTDTLGRLGNIHVPNVETTIREFLAHPVIDKAVAAGAAYVLADVLPGKYAAALKKGAKGYLQGMVAFHVLFWSTHSPEGYVPSYRTKTAASQQQQQDTAIRVTGNG
jgi:hypothetical protein